LSHPRSGPIVVTGGAGFLGSHVVDALRTASQPVIVVDDLSSGTDANVPPDVPIERLDVADERLESFIHRVRPVVVVHAAARASVPRSTADPVGDARANILGTIRVAGASRDVGAHLVHISSGGALAGEPERLPVSEDDPATPISAYGTSKWAAEAYVRLLCPSATILRPANVYGPRQRRDLEGGVVAIFVDRHARGEPLEVHGDGHQSRDFVHARDVAEAVRLAAEARTVATLNISTARATSIRDLVAVLADVSGRAPTVVTGPPRAGDVRASLLDNARAAAVLGWAPSIDLRTGLAELWVTAHGQRSG
jgi:UDP-glucose 4-epimerase